MPILKRNKSSTVKPYKPEVVTGGFELHFEDVIHRNRAAMIALFATGLVAITAFIPGAVFQSYAREDHVSLEAESGIIINPDLVTIVNGDMTANNNSYIEFNIPD
ncbi:MAG: hypothetical protein M3Q36_00530 [bacterium]|nr:hypothetical protein [bacterium]